MDASLTKQSRGGVTLVELLVVLAIVGVLLATVVPAVQAVRESARRVTCQNHVRQMGLAILNYEATSGFLPCATYGRPYEYIPQGRRPPGNIVASAFTDLLGYLEQDGVAESYVWGQDWFAEVNQAAVNAPIALFRCPSTSGPDYRIGIGSGGGFAAGLSAAVGDYSTVYSWGFPMAVPASPPSYDVWGVSALSPALEGGGFSQPRIAQTKDGMANTLTLVEQADQGRRWIKRKLVDPNPLNARAWAPWAGESSTWLLSYLADGKTWSPTGLGPGNINVNNSQGIYGFHPHGATVGLLDASVRFLAEPIDPLVLYAMVTRSRGELSTLP